MRDKKRRKIQRQMNKKFKMWNKALNEDPLWRGRFQIGQLNTYYDKFEDGSGGILYINGIVYDKKTHKWQDFAVHNYGWHYDFFDAINDFITLKSGVWDNIEEVKNDKTNWSKVIWHP